MSILAHLIHFVVGAALLVHVMFWGVGGAMLAMPRRWRRFWPVLIVPMGFALQSAVVWIGAHAGWRGTNSYAWAAEAAPVVLLAAGLWRRGVRACWIDVSRFGLVWLAMAGCLALLVLPQAIAAKGLTTVSLGSCDAGDYAAGARVLQEFARTDREGFLGLAEVVCVQSVDNFFDYWTRLNHFTPSALIAFNGSILDCAPHELTGLFAMVMLASSLPLVFWIARAAVGYNGGASLVITLLYGLSPVTWYAVAHVAPGQLLAAQAVALITWAGVALWRGRLDWRRGAQFAAVLAAGYWLVLGSYNFFLVVCLVPAVAFAGGLALWQGRWARLAKWAAIVVAPLVACGVLFFERVAGLAERFALLREFDFGWRIPVLWPEGWLGMVKGATLDPWHFAGARWLLMALVVAMLAWAMNRAVAQGRRNAWLVVAFAVPVLVGYAYLEWRGEQLGTNASYDAYKLFAVFLPLLLPAFCWWATLRRSGRLVEWLTVAGFALLVVLMNFAAAAMFVVQMARPPLMVDGELRQLRKIEAMPDVTSINVLLPDMWSRLWANAFLLRKPQYFLTDSYEARWHTPLRGEWDLVGNSILVRGPGHAPRQLTAHYALVDTRQPDYVRADFGVGWYEEERARDGDRWRWSKAHATVRFENPHDRPVRVRCTLDVRSLGTREIECTLPGGGARRESFTLGEARRKVALPACEIPPGSSEIVLQTGAATGAAGDTRELGVCVFGVEVELQP
jgi:hypothetical protein